MSMQVTQECNELRVVKWEREKRERCDIASSKKQIFVRTFTEAT
jgi:hypothetical protein